MPHIQKMSSADQGVHQTAAVEPRTLDPQALLQPATSRTTRSLRNKLKIGFAALLGVAALLIGAFLVLGAVTGTHTMRSVAYAEIPPHSGDHSPVWQRCGFYGEPVRNEHAVHSLEHGAVWITYQPDLPTEQVDALRAMAGAEEYVLVSPYADLPAPVVVSSWDQQVRFDSVEDPVFAASVQDFLANSLAPEPDGGCDGPNLWLSGATGNPEK